MVELIESGGQRGLVDGGGDHRHRLRLKFHRLADAVGRGLHLFDRTQDRAVGFDRLAGRLLDRGDLRGDVVGRTRRLRSEALHFLGDDREAAAGIAGARRFDGRVEREQIGLAGDVADQAEDRFDRFDVRGQRLADLHGLAGLIAGTRGDAGRNFDFGTRVLDGADQAGGSLRSFAHRNGRLFGGGGDFAGLAEHSAGRGDVERVRSVSAFDCSVLASTSSVTRRSNCSLSRPRVSGLDGFEQGNLRQDDVGFEGAHAHGRRRAFRQLGGIVGESSARRAVMRLAVCVRAAM